jgi:uncharacterized membrane protein YkoI
MHKAVYFGAVVVAAVSALAAFNRKGDRIMEKEPGLLAQAVITPDQARQTALEAVPGGRIIEAEIEDEDGRLIYAFEIEVDGAVTDLEVDAKTGAVIPQEAEDDDAAGEDDEDREDDKIGR